jgi:hypothetical protein
VIFQGKPGKQMRQENLHRIQNNFPIEIESPLLHMKFLHIQHFFIIRKCSITFNNYVNRNKWVDRKFNVFDTSISTDFINYKSIK